MSESDSARSSKKAPCICTEESGSTAESTLSPSCECPKDDHEIVIHQEDCLLFKNETFIYTEEEREPPRGVEKAGREVFDEWRRHRDVGALPAVLESTHPLMQRFQQTLKEFLLKENAIAEAELVHLKDELRETKQAYNKDLEAIYKSDHDTNSQRKLIEEYESSLAQRTAERQAADQSAKEAAERNKRAIEKLEQDLMTEREATQELEALTTLCKQLEQWRDETESGLTVSNRMSDKMRAEKRQLAEEKRELDMIIFGLSSEVWKLESKLEMFQKQLEIKNVEMDKVNDKVTAYAAELEDLELDKRRLMSLWNSVLVNISQRDKVYDSVKEDYRMLQENYRTLISNLEITKKVSMEEMNKGKEISMHKDKILYDMEYATKLFETEDRTRVAHETKIAELNDSIDMSERDQELIKMENQTLNGILKSITKECDRKSLEKLNLENEILANLQERLLNDKAVESMANGIKKMRDLSRKQEITLTAMENQHAKLMLDIEIRRNRQAYNNMILEQSLKKVQEREKEIDQLQEKFDQKALMMLRKQRDLDGTIKRYNTMKELFNLKSPQERLVEDLEQQIKALRERTDKVQQEWLRVQGLVVRQTEQHQKMVTEINLINKQIQICDQKTMRIQAEIETVMQEKVRVDRTLRDLRGRLELLERTRKDAVERNDNSQRAVVSITQEYAANLKGSEMAIIELEEEIDAMDKEKMDLSQELDRATREALIWQRKGILAVELKKTMKDSKSTAGEIGQMKSEIHRMEVRREQLRRTSEKLAEDLAFFVIRRENALEKTRASAAVEKAHGSNHISQTSYRHKLRLARSDVARVTKELNEAQTRLKQLQEEQVRLDRDLADSKAHYNHLEEQIATLMRECIETDRQKQWLLERVVRSQRLGSELATVVKRQSVHVKKPKSTILHDYNAACALNDRIKYIVECLTKEYPNFGEKLTSIANTLDIHTPSGSPRLTQSPSVCGPIEEVEENVAERPLED